HQSLMMKVKQVVLFLISSCIGSISFGQMTWKVRPEAEVTDKPDQLCRADYDAGHWVSAIVPGTVFGAYVAAGLEQDPNFGDNIYRVDKAKYDRNFWYRGVFGPVSSMGGRTWL